MVNGRVLAPDGRQHESGRRFRDPKITTDTVTPVTVVDKVQLVRDIKAFDTVGRIK